MLTDRERLLRQKSAPALVTLHRSLSRLTSVLTMMNTGAHPDDEQNGLLAALRFGLGIRVVVACSTRGEGGQNSLGPERTGALGIVRSREMEESARVIDADIAWLGHGPDDMVHDFGFSKNGKDTLSRWGRDRIIERLVRAYRTERPDIVLPTFLDVPGQHGHHRAMTEAAEAAIALAADPNAFPEHFAEGLSTWQVSKYYLPAWSGGGGTYDDEVPPPVSTLTVSAPGRDAATGAGFDQIGEWSRTYHASQGMGRWRSERKTEWPLHLLLGRAHNGTESDIRENLPATLADVAALPGVPDGAATALVLAQEAINAALGAFPDRDRIIENLAEAARQLEGAEAKLTDDSRTLIGHRIMRKQREVDAALLEAAGVAAEVWAQPNFLAPGGSGTLRVYLEDGSTAANVEVTPVLPQGVTSGAAAIEANIVIYPLSVAADAPLSPQYLPGFSRLGGNGPASVRLTAEVGGRRVEKTLDLDEALHVAPAQPLELDPPAILLPLSSSEREWMVKAHTDAPIVALETPAGWDTKPRNGGFMISAPKQVDPALYVLTPTIGGRPAFRSTPIAYPHIGRTAYFAEEHLRVLALDLVLPKGAVVGYVGGGADNVGTWLPRMGLDVTALDAEALAGDLSRYTTIVVGIFAFGLRHDLAAARPRLKEWVEAGGHLVTLYHRPSDGWDPDWTPPRHIVIGSPSLRWRVTNPDAQVEVLEPDNPLLTGPNVIGPEDFAGWNKERGLYFAAQWHKVYTPLLSMHDAGEKPLRGALITAKVGKGRHTHTSLVLHHQMDRLVPGAFRLMANLVQPA
ncbi:MAG TPA: PIG-L family deacetylase [Devosiaceae bacterium]|jgi:LmbE family N-acetylglucosaminyl deacetylase